MAVWALFLTIVSGAAVRLTGSGLGCPDWPNCTNTHVVAPLQFHAWVEFGNRLINAAVSIASVGAFFAALLRVPRRRDLTALAGALLIGLFAEVVMGAVVVYTKLAPTAVSVHFLLGLVFLGVTVLLHYRASLHDEDVRREPVPMVGRRVIALARLQLLALVVVVALGTVVTSTGPHGGSPHVHRFHFSLHSVAQLHGTSVETFLALTLLMLWTLVRTGAPVPVTRRAQIMLASLIAQAAIGYTQYLNGDPVALVAVHVAGASVVVITTLRFYLGLWHHSRVAEPGRQGEAPGLDVSAPGPVAPAVTTIGVRPE